MFFRDKELILKSHASPALNKANQVEDPKMRRTRRNPRATNEDDQAMGDDEAENLQGQAQDQNQEDDDDEDEREEGEDEDDPPNEDGRVLEPPVPGAEGAPAAGEAVPQGAGAPPPVHVAPPVPQGAVGPAVAAAPNGAVVHRAANAVGGGAAAAATAAVPFALSPIDSTRGVINFRTKHGKELYKSATLPLSQDQFGCDPLELRDFLQLLSYRAASCGWDKSILLIPVRSGSPFSTNKSLLDKYGEIPIDQVRAYELTFIFSQTRQAQDTYMLAQCLMASLSQEGRQKVTPEENKYVLHSPTGEKLYSGILLLKIIITKTTVEGAAASRNTRKQLAKLDTLIPKLGFDITLFNTKVKEHIHDLLAQGQTSEDLPFNLMKAYKVVPGETFKIFIQNLQTKMDDTPMGVEQILETVESKFKSLQLDDDWNVPTATDQKILALEAQVERQGKLLKDKKDGKGNKKGAKKNSAAKHPKKEKKKFDRTVKPKNPNKPIEINGKTWHWCGKDTGGKCEMMRLHKPSECKGIGGVAFSNSNDSKRSKEKGSNGSKKKGKKLKLTKALAEASIADAEESSEDEEGSMDCSQALIPNSNFTEQEMWGPFPNEKK